jgi:hypothetical protein
MAKELPYFRFTPQEWQNGDISLERFELRGLFIDICCYYWIKDCSITLAMLDKRYNNDENLLDELIKLGIICLKKDSEFIKISFLDEQFDLLSEQRKRRQDAGSIGGKQKASNAKAMLKQKPSYNDKDKDKDKRIGNINSDNDFEDIENQFNDINFKDTTCISYSINTKDLDKQINTFLTQIKLTKKYKEMSISDLKMWFLNKLNKLPKNSKYAYLTDADKMQRGVSISNPYIFIDDTYRMVHKDDLGEYVNHNSEKIYI